MKAAIETSRNACITIYTLPTAAKNPADLLWELLINADHYQMPPLLLIPSLLPSFLSFPFLPSPPIPFPSFLSFPVISFLFPSHFLSFPFLFFPFLSFLFPNFPSLSFPFLPFPFLSFPSPPLSFPFPSFLSFIRKSKLRLLETFQKQKSAAPSFLSSIISSPHLVFRFFPSRVHVA